LIKTANRFPQQTKALDWHLVEACNESMHLSLDGHPNAVNAFQALADPASGWRRGGMVDVVRHGFLVMGQWLAHAALCHRLAPSGERHHHQEALDTAGLVDKHRRDQNPRLFEKPDAPCHLGLAFVGRDDVGILPLIGADMGADPTTGVALLLVLNGRFSRLDMGLELPGDGLDRQARCRAALARVAFMVTEVGGVALVIRPALGQCRQRLVSGFRRREALGVAVKERRVDRLTCAVPGVVERGRGALIGRRGIPHPPTLGHPVVAQLTTLLAGWGIKTLPTVHREGVRAHLRHRAHGVGNACDQAEVAEVGGSVFVVQL
jgi:hypothetical protein